MKSKAEEKRQFKYFLSKLEPGGYLDMMFGNLLFYVEKQIADDFGVDINSIIQGYNEAYYDLKRAKEKLEELTKTTAEYEITIGKLAEELDVAVTDLSKAKVDSDIINRSVEHLKNEMKRTNRMLHDIAVECDALRAGRKQLEAMARVAKKHEQFAKEEVIKYKAKLFDLMEEKNG